MESIFGDLVEFNTNKEFEVFFETIEKDSAIKILEIAFNHAQKSGVFNLKESYCIYNCLKNLKKETKE